MRSISVSLFLAAVIGIAGFAVACGDNDEAAHIEEATATADVGAIDDVPTQTAEVTKEPTAEPTDARPVVNAELNEWSITLDISSVPSGETLYVATNSGALPHELVFLRTDRPFDDLPVGSDDKVNRFAEGIEDLGVIRTDDLVPDATVSKPFNLPAGNYALICNIPGHYSAGMSAEFTIQ